jgi:hypothetical protein
MRSRAIIWGVLIVIGLIASYFTVSSGDAVKWNDKVVALHLRLRTAWGRHLQTPLESWAKGKTIDAAQLDSSFTAYSRDIGQAAAELRREAPPDDDLCKAMHAEMVKFADLEETMLKDQATLIGEVKASNPGKPEDIKRVSEAFDEMGKKEAVQEAVVTNRQAAMAAKFKIKLK